MRPDGSPSAVAGAADTISHGASLTAAARGELTAAARRPAWTGEAANRFQDGVARMEGGFTTLIDASTSAAAALRAYSAELTRLQGKADALADQFAGYGIAIDPAGRAVPTPGLHDPVTLDDNLRRHGPLFEDQARSLRHEADQAAADAIHRIDAARALLHERTKFGAFIKSQFLEPFNLANTALSIYTSAAGTHATVKAALARREAELKALRKELERKTSKARKAKAAERYSAVRDGTAKLRLNLRKNVVVSNSVAQKLPLSTRLGATFEQAVADRSVQTGLSRLGRAPVVRSLPAIGTGLTAMQTSYEISKGESPTKAITTNAASLIAGSVAAEGAVVLVAGLTAVAGAPIIAGLAAGTLAAVGVGYAVNAFFETEIGHDVAQAIDHTVGDAAEAVGNTVSTGWRKLFG